MTIDEMQQQRSICQAAILEALDKFSWETGCVVDRVNLQTTHATLMGAKKQTFIYSVRLTVEL